MPRQVSGVRCLALGSGDRLFIGTVDNNIWRTSLNGDLDSPLKGSGANLVKIMEVSSTSLCISTRKPEKPEILVGNSHETLENLGYRLYSDQPFPFFFLFAVNPCINTISQNWSYAYQRILSIKLTVKRTNAGRRRHFFFFLLRFGCFWHAVNWVRRCTSFVLWYFVSVDEKIPLRIGLLKPGSH